MGRRYLSIFLLKSFLDERRARQLALRLTHFAPIVGINTGRDADGLSLRTKGDGVCHEPTFGFASSSPLTARNPVFPSMEKCEREYAFPYFDARSWHTPSPYVLNESPSGDEDPSNGYILDISGLENYYGSEEKLLGKVKRELEALGVPAKLASASTIGIAWAVSHFDMRQMVVLGSFSREKLKQILGEFPIEALRVESSVCEALQAVGICSLYQLFNVPRETLGERFGKDLNRKIDQFLGETPETIDSVKSPRLFYRERSFNEPLASRRAVQAVLFKLFEDLHLDLQTEEKKAKNFRLQLKGREISGDPYQIRKEINLHAPLTDHKILKSVLQTLVETLPLKGGVEKLRVTALDTEALIGADQNLMESKQLANVHSADSASQSNTSPPELPNHVVTLSAEELLHNLILRLGRERIHALHFKSSYIPERSFAFLPFDTKRNKATEILNVPRPTLILRAPIPAEVICMLPDKPPAWLKWRGKRERILKGIGPERIEEEWWHEVLSEEEASRDYFRVQNEEGLWLWVFRRNEQQRWFVHGVWA